MRMDDKMLVEKIIETIKEHPILYDSTQPTRNHLKESIWQEIANTYNIDVHVLKMKWKNLRDCYKKHIRAQMGDDSKAVVSYKYWQWSAYLDFLRPHIRYPNTQTHMFNCDVNDDVNCINDDIDIKMEHHTNSDSDCESAEYITQPQILMKSLKHSSAVSDNLDSKEKKLMLKKRHKTSRRNEITAEQDHRREIHEFDGTELIFLGYAKTVKSMTLKRQINVKMKIAKIIMEEEMKDLE